MSMYRQLWLAIVVSTSLALGGSLLASLLSARGYLESQLSIKNADNAAALALSLSRGNPDSVMVDLVVASMFDSGHYEQIRITDPMGRSMSERVTQDGVSEVPRWFTHLLPLHATPGIAQITSGWKQFGVVTLISHSRFAYEALWKTAYDMVFVLAVAGLLGGYLCSMVLRHLNGALNLVVEQATAITQRRFVSIEVPKLPELNQLVLAMNAMVGRLKTMFDDEASRLELVRKEANYDSLTGLANRNYFMAQLSSTSIAEDSTGATVFIARVANLAAVNNAIGRSATDNLLRGFGKVIDATAGQYSDAMAARLNGADFALLVPGVAMPYATADDLLHALAREAAGFLPDQPTTWLGFGHFPRGTETKTILAEVDGALATLEAEGRNGLRMVDKHDGSAAPRSADEWTKMIRHVLEHGWVRLASFPVTTLHHKLMHQECPLRLMFSEHGEWQPAGRFLPVAVRLKLTPQLDLVAIKLGLDELEAKPQLTGLAINLSASSIQMPEFRSELQKLLKRRAVGSRLWLEVAESGVFSHFDAFRTMCEELRGFGCQLGIEHFGRQFSEIGRLHDLGLDYLKVDASFIHGLESNIGNQLFLKGLSTIAHGIGLKVIAEGVTNAAELEVLTLVGFDGATGPAISELG